MTVPTERTLQQVIRHWSPEERSEAAKNFAEFIAILRGWDSVERLERAKRMLESSTQEGRLESR